MEGLRWWLLVLSGCAVAYFVWWSFRKSFRKQQRAELVKALRAERPDLELVEEREDFLRMRPASGKEALYRLSDFYDALQLTNRRPTALQKVRRKFALAIAEGRREVTRLTLAADGERILPRLVSKEFLALPARKALPRKELAGTGLFVAYCLDGDETVRFLTHQDRKELDLPGGSLHDLALRNLAARTDMRKVARAALESDAVNLVKFGDAFDATRVLLLPDVLRDGEVLAAIVPDRDTLMLARAPKGDWHALVDLARSIERDATVSLLEVPLEIDAKGLRRREA